LFRSLAADHLEGISASFSNTAMFLYPWFDSSNAVDNPNAPPPMMAIGSFLGIPILTDQRRPPQLKDKLDVRIVSHKG
jgi:hypothetical protein